MKRKLSWKPDLPDQRDYTFYQYVDENRQTISENLPMTVSLRKWCTELEDQRTLGSCVANAVVSLLEYNQCRSGHGGPELVNLSRLFCYYNYRLLGDNVEEDSGAYIRDGIKTAKLNGVCPSKDWPYRVEYWKHEPPKKCYETSVPFKITKYYRLDTVDQMLLSIANGRPFVFGVAVYDSFISNTVAETGIVPMPSMTERLLGGHAMMAMGYDVSTQRFLVRNSWGKNWGLKEGNLGGYCTIPFAYLENRNLSDDFWTAT